MSSILKPSLSTILVSFFFCILLFLGLFAEVFESQAPEVDLAQIYANPIPVDELQHLKSVRLSNKQGNFAFENTHPEGNLEGPWQMQEPQPLRVKNEVISKIVEALNLIRVRNFHRLEPINLSSFSLDNPTMTLLFVTDRDRTYEVKMGLINPIDNSAYMLISTQNQIYQIDPMEIALESYELAQLAESRVLALNTATLASVELSGVQGLMVKLIKKDEGWVDQMGTPLSAKKVEKFFERLEDLRSSSILENLSNEQKTFMDGVMAKPLYGLRLISPQGVRSYFIAELKDGIPGMALTNETRYVLSSEERNSFVLIDKDQIKVFALKHNELK